MAIHRTSSDETRHLRFNATRVRRYSATAMQPGTSSPTTVYLAWVSPYTCQCNLAECMQHADHPKGCCAPTSQEPSKDTSARRHIRVNACLACKQQRGCCNLLHLLA